MTEVTPASFDAQYASSPQQRALAALRRRDRAARAPLVYLAAGTLALGFIAIYIVSLPTSAISEKPPNDFIQFWTAAKLIYSGHSPYDPALQAALQQQLGWNTQRDGLGLYTFLPYYYPPWLALTCVLLLPLGYAKAKAAWFLINVGLLLSAGLLVRNVVRGLSPIVALVFVCLFAPCVITVLMGQVSILVLFPVIIAWRLLEKRRDTAAGVALAWLTIKPQLTVVLLLALLIWCGRQGRWRVFGGFVAALTLLVLASTLVFPSWPIEMATATRTTTLPTDLLPWTGATLFTVLTTIGARGAIFWLCYLAVAVPFIAIVARVALDRTSRVEHLLAISLIAPFFVAPYGRHYDFSILLVPALILISDRGGRFRAALLVTLLVLPYVHLAMLGQLAAWLGMSSFPGPQFTFFWMPLLVAVAFLLAQPSDRYSAAI